MTHVVAVGGTDPSGGAGLTRDAAMAQSLGCTVKPVVTAITVQTNTEVRVVDPVSVSLLQAQLQAALTEPRPAAIKIGLVATAEQVTALTAALPDDLPVVLDPVLRASSGGRLSPVEGLRPLLRKRVTLLTPNLPECASLTGRPHARTQREIDAQAALLLALGPQAVLIKGGHGVGCNSTDHLFIRGQAQPFSFSAPRLTLSVRGTGCSLATAIACALAKGTDLAAACETGKSTITTWLRAQRSDPIS